MIGPHRRVWDTMKPGSIRTTGPPISTSPITLRKITMTSLLKTTRNPRTSDRSGGLPPQRRSMSPLDTLQTTAAGMAAQPRGSLLPPRPTQAASYPRRPSSPSIPPVRIHGALTRPEGLALYRSKFTQINAHLWPRTTVDTTITQMKSGPLPRLVNRHRPSNRIDYMNRHPLPRSNPTPLVYQWPLKTTIQTISVGGISRRYSSRGRT